MSVPVDLAGLHERVAEFGARAYLVTVGGDGRPHTVSVVVAEDGERLTMGAGRRTAANVAERPAVTLLWPPTGGGEYSLIVDGTGSLAGAQAEPSLSVLPTTAVLHRIAGAAGDGPTCIGVSAGDEP